MRTYVYETCGHPTWNDAACQKCDGCRDGRAHLRGVLRSAQNAVAIWDNDPSMIEPALDELRSALDYKASLYKDSPTKT